MRRVLEGEVVVADGRGHDEVREAVRDKPDLVRRAVHEDRFGLGVGVIVPLE